MEIRSQNSTKDCNVYSQVITVFYSSRESSLKNGRSVSQQGIELFLDAEGYKRSRVVEAIDDQMVTYTATANSNLGLTIFEYEDGGWDIGHGFSPEDKVADMQELIQQLWTMRSMIGPIKPRPVILTGSS